MTYGSSSGSMAQRTSKRIRSDLREARDNPYLVKAVVHAACVLAAFRRDEALTVNEIHRRSGLSRGIVFRLVYTLERCGLVETIAKGLHRRGPRRVRTSLSAQRLKQLVQSHERTGERCEAMPVASP